MPGTSATGYHDVDHDAERELRDWAMSGSHMRLVVEPKPNRSRHEACACTLDSALKPRCASCPHVERVVFT